MPLISSQNERKGHAIAPIIRLLIINETDDVQNSKRFERKKHNNPPHRRIQSEQLDELKAETVDLGSRIVLDLSEVMDVEVICFLSDREDEAAEVIHCSLYIKEWIRRERDARKK